LFQQTIRPLPVPIPVEHHQLIIAIHHPHLADVPGQIPLFGVNRTKWSRVTSIWYLTVAMTILKKTEVQVTEVLESLHLLDLSTGLKIPLLPLVSIKCIILLSTVSHSPSQLVRFTDNYLLQG
jgi:hypothetical protein